MIDNFELKEIKLFYIEYKDGFLTFDVLIEADNFSEAESLFNTKYGDKFTISKITRYGVNTFIKSVKNVNTKV